MNFFKTLVVLNFVFLIYFNSACESTTVNKPLRIKDGEKVSGDISSVNGSIRIGKDCQISGDCRTVNGTIDIGQNSVVDEIQTVNGRIRIDENALINDDVSVVNGEVDVDKGASVKGDISTVNGKIMLIGAKVKRNIQTYNGNIRLLEGSEVKGDIIIKETHGKQNDQLIIEILDASVVRGNIRVEDKSREVTVFKSSNSKIVGKVINADVVEK